MAIKIRCNEDNSFKGADAYLCQAFFKNSFRDFRMGDCRVYRDVADLVKEFKADPDPDIGVWNSARNLTKDEAEAAAKRIMAAVPGINARYAGYMGTPDDAKKYWVTVEAPMCKIWPLHFGRFAPAQGIPAYLVGGELLTKAEFAEKMKALVLG